MENHFNHIIEFIRSLYNQGEKIPLHAPIFIGNEKKYLTDCIDSTYVSYVGSYVTKFEESICKYTGAKYAVAIVNGTAALQLALKTCGVNENTEVITQPFTFVATCNAIAHNNADPIFIDIDSESLGICPLSLEKFLAEMVILKDGAAYNKISKKRIAACVPVHTFGHPSRIDEIVEICSNYNIPVVEDAAESLGSFYNQKHTGTFGKAGIISFNGNKTITTGGGGMVITDDETVYNKVKHISTTAKVSHPWEFNHDEIGFNCRMPNVNAAIGCAQLENLPHFLNNKRELAEIYEDFFNSIGIGFIKERSNCISNYWLNTIQFKNQDEQQDFLAYSNAKGIMTRPPWKLMNTLSMFKNCYKTELRQAELMAHTLVNIPSSVRQ